MAVRTAGFVPIVALVYFVQVAQEDRRGAFIVPAILLLLGLVDFAGWLRGRRLLGQWRAAGAWARRGSLEFADQGTQARGLFRAGSAGLEVFTQPWPWRYRPVVEGPLIPGDEIASAEVVPSSIPGVASYTALIRTHASEHWYVNAPDAEGLVAALGYAP